MKRGVLLIIGVLLAAQLGAADFSEERKVIGATAEAFELYAERMGSAGSGEQITWALNELAATLEELAPEMNRLSEEYPAWWGEDPPAAVAELMERYQRASRSFNHAMGRAVMYANSHMDDTEFQKAFRRANTAIYEMYK